MNGDYLAIALWVSIGSLVLTYDATKTYLRTHPRKHKKATS